MKLWKDLTVEEQQKKIEKFAYENEMWICDVGELEVSWIIEAHNKEAGVENGNG